MNKLLKIRFRLNKKIFNTNNIFKKGIFRFSTQEYQEPDDMAAFYKAVKSKVRKIKEEEDPNPANLRKVWNFKNTIAWTLSSIILYIRDYHAFSGIFFIVSLRNYLVESRMNMMIYIMADEYFSQIKNKKIFFGYEVLKEYIFKHPEIRIYFNEQNSILYAHVWGIHNPLSIGKGFNHEDNLSFRRYMLHSKIINLSSKLNAKLEARILYFTPSEFEIEYMRVDLDNPYFKKITIIDGRRDQKDWVDELQEGKINKTTFTKYRDSENIKY